MLIANNVQERASKKKLEEYISQIEKEKHDLEVSTSVSYFYSSVHSSLGQAQLKETSETFVSIFLCAKQI